MKLGLILELVKKLLPTKKISAWILGLIAAGIATFVGVNNAELKEEYCSSKPVDLPKVEAPVEAK